MRRHQLKLKNKSVLIGKASEVWAKHELCAIDKVGNYVKSFGGREYFVVSLSMLV